jgi:hypothetical protein
MVAEESYETQRERANLLWFIAPIQLLLFVAVFTLPFGFDKKSSLGLDFGHLLLFAAVYVTAVLFGLSYAAFSARWRWFGAQLFVFLLAAGITWLVASGIVSTSRQNDYHRLPLRPPLSKDID